MIKNPENIITEKAHVSVIIPCFRCSDTIERAIASISAQIMQPEEVILIDDYSNDGTLEMLYRIQKEYPAGWIKVIALSVNSGPGTARNRGWEVANQPYIAFLDADDSWHPEKIKIQYSWMNQHPEVSLSAHQTIQIHADEQPPANDFFIVPNDFYQVGKIKLLLSNRFPTRSVMLRRDIPQRFVNGKRYSEDFHLWTEICCSGLLCYKSDLPLAYIYKAPFGEGGLSASLWKMQKGQLDTYHSLFKQGYVRLGSLTVLYAWSWLRFLRRLIIVITKKPDGS